MRKLRTAMAILIEELPLPAAYLDHPLRGNWHGFRDLHIEPDWLMIYRIVGEEVQFARSGTHSDLFDE